MNTLTLEAIIYYGIVEVKKSSSTELVSPMWNIFSPARLLHNEYIHVYIHTDIY